MATIFGLDIPSGLEDLYARLLSLFNDSGAVSVKKLQPIRTVRAKSAIAMRSLFVQWAPIYDSLAPYCKDNWTRRWLELPFSSHVGLDGWPGSGFSAFVYENASRRRAGQSLLYCWPDYPGTWTDDFEGYSLGDIDHYGGWRLLSNAIGIVENTHVHGGSQALAISASSLSTGGVRKTTDFDLVSAGTRLFSFYFYTESHGLFGFFLLKNQAVPNSDGLWIQGGSPDGLNIQTQPLGNTEFLSGVNLSAWNFLEIDVDGTNKKVRVRLNGSSWTPWLTYTAADCVTFTTYAFPAANFVLDDCLLT